MIPRPGPPGTPHRHSKYAATWTHELDVLHLERQYAAKAAATRKFLERYWEAFGGVMALQEAAHVAAVELRQLLDHSARFARDAGKRSLRPGVERLDSLCAELAALLPHVRAFVESIASRRDLEDQP